MFSRLSRVQGPEENHAQIPERILANKGTSGTVNTKKKKCGEKVRNFGLSSADIQMFISGIHSLPTWIICTPTWIICTAWGSIVRNIRASA